VLEVSVLMASFPYAINWSQANVPAILHMTHNSEESGNALADVLFGDVNPGGKLVHTWPKSLEQLPPMLDYDLRHGRTYMYFEGEPLYPFGYGLSYTMFKTSKLRVTSRRLGKDGAVTVKVDVKNTGKRRTPAPAAPTRNRNAPALPCGTSVKTESLCALP
jgi:beta-glucosidase